MADSSAPIVIVYDSDVTYNQATTQMADSGVYDKLTFELLMDETKQNKLKVQSNKPNGPIDRLLSDVLGLVVLYATTFLFCDLYRTWKTGRWTRLMWMFLGPWNALTGAPLLHKITSVFDSHGKGTIQNCEKSYSFALKKCDVDILDGQSASQCRANAQRDYQNCYMATDEFQECKETASQTCQDTCYNNPLVKCNDSACSDTSLNVDCLDKLGYDPQ